MDNKEKGGSERKRDKFAAAIKNILRSSKDDEDSNVPEQMRDYISLGAPERSISLDPKKYKSTPTDSPLVNRKDLRLDVPAAVARSSALNKLDRPLSHPDTATLGSMYDILDAMVADNMAMIKGSPSPGSSRIHSILFDNSSSDEDDDDMENNYVNNRGLTATAPDGRASVKIGDQQPLPHDIPEGRLLSRFESSLESVTDLVSKMKDDEEKIKFIEDLQYNLYALRGLVEDNVNMAVISSVLIPEPVTVSRMKEEKEKPTIKIEEQDEPIIKAQERRQASVRPMRRIHSLHKF